MRRKGNGRSLVARRSSLVGPTLTSPEPRAPSPGLRSASHESRATSHGFTLVELLVVIAIITMLAGLVVGAAQSARRRAAVTRAQVAIAGLETAIEMHETDTGAWPASGNEALVVALEGPSQTAGWEGPYMRFKEGDLQDGALLDPWGRPYRYRVPGDAAHGHEQYFDLSSDGPDGTAGTADDVTNW